MASLIYNHPRVAVATTIAAWALGCVAFSILNGTKNALSSLQSKICSLIPQFSSHIEAPQAALIEKVIQSVPPALALLEDIPNSVMNLDLDLRESSRGSSILSRPILTIRLLKEAPRGDQLARFEALPLHIKQKLYQFIWISQGAPVGDDRFAEKLLKGNIDVLFQKQPPFICERGDSLIDQMMESMRGQGDPSKSIQTLLKEHSYLTRAQFEETYKLLPLEVKNSLPAAAKPPYYGVGIQTDLHHRYGAHAIENGMRFRVYAPHASFVEVVILYEGRPTAQKRSMLRDAQGSWACNFLGVQEGCHYQYQISTRDGQILRKMDPISFQTVSVGNPVGDKTFRHESVIFNPLAHAWQDTAWVKRRATEAAIPKPINIYEMYPPSFKKRAGQSVEWEALADEMIPYCIGRYTHVELMGVLDYPNEKSMGYQVTSFFSPSHWMGEPQGLQRFVDKLHQAGIGVILDFIPNHFAVDPFSLNQFDGENLFERGSSEWGCPQFDLESSFVRNFLLSSTRHWVEQYHIDGIRVDAIDAILAGNRPGANLFLRDFNADIHAHYPGVLTIGEDSGGHPITQPIKEGGYGFDYQWGMGSMHHLLRGFLAKSDNNHSPRPFAQRPKVFKHLQTAIECHLNQKIIFALSHDEVSMMKNHFINKVPGDSWKKHAGVRQIIGFLATARGGKLTIMGTEFAQENEFSDMVEKSEEFPRHQMGNLAKSGVRTFNDAIYKFYLQTPAFWELDDAVGVPWKWVNRSDSENCVLSFLRMDNAGNRYLCVHNFRENAFQNYELKFLESKSLLGNVTQMEEVINSDRAEYGGSGLINSVVTMRKDSDTLLTQGCQIALPALSTLIFKLS